MKAQNIQQPLSIVIDREFTLINSINTWLPQYTHIPCRWHVNMNVFAKTKSTFLVQLKVQHEAQDCIKVDIVEEVEENMCRCLDKIASLSTSHLDSLVWYENTDVNVLNSVVVNAYRFVWGIKNLKYKKFKVHIYANSCLFSTRRRTDHVTWPATFCLTLLLNRVCSSKRHTLCWTLLSQTPL